MMRVLRKSHCRNAGAIHAALFLTEAGNNIGFGHWMRTSALQVFFAGKGVKTLMLLNLKGASNRLSAVNANKKILQVDWLKERPAVENKAKDFDVVIVDSYLAGKDYYNFLKSIFKRIIVLDDYNRIKYPADIIINPNLYGDFVDYGNQSAKVFGGKDYIILREIFIKYGRKFIVRGKVARVLLSLGGSDYRNLVPVILDLIKYSKLEINVITGTEEYRKKLKALYVGKNIKIYGYLNASEMASLMVKADIVITGAGQTLNELAFLGIPAIAICIDTDQAMNLKAYFESGFLIKKLFWNDPGLPEKLLFSLSRMQEKGFRLKLSRCGKRLVHNNGPEKIYKIINNRMRKGAQ